MSSIMCNVDEVTKMLKMGKALLLAGDEDLLKKIPKGNWIGGTIPYFMAAEGGLISKDKVFVTELPHQVQRVSIQPYDENSISNVYVEAPNNGFSIIILPAASPVHFSFAVNAPNFKDFASRPLVGWVSGVHLNDLGKITPKVFNGATGEMTDKKAFVLRAELSTDWVCDIGIVNIFSQSNDDVIEFLESGFTAKDILVNGQKTSFIQYTKDHNLDTKRPLVANYYGENVNVCLQSLDESSGVVTFYAPVFEGVKYRFANPVTDYMKEFESRMPKNRENVLFSCNCVLNFLYLDLEGKQIGSMTGPATFGEIAYQLLNQTLVYLTIDKVS